MASFEYIAKLRKTENVVYIPKEVFEELTRKKYTRVKVKLQTVKKSNSPKLEQDRQSKDKNKKKK